MAITKREEHSVEVLFPYVVHCHTSEIIEEDGVEIGRNHKRYSKFPGDDMTGECTEMQEAAAALWTDEVIAAYRDSITNT